MKYLLGRLAFTAAAVWAALSLAFILPRLIPGDPGTVLLANFRGKLRPEAIEAMRAVFGLSREPLLAQYFAYLRDMLSGDLGTSLSRFPAPVTEVIAGAFGWTVVLGGIAVVFSFVLGSALGLLAAWRRGGMLDAILPGTLTLLGALPYFWVATLALYWFGYGVGWFPVRHAHDDALSPGWNWVFFKSAAAHAVLPAGTIVVATLGGWLLGMRNTVVGVLHEDFMTFARGQGLGTARLMAYAARSALLPNLTAFGMALGFVVSGALLTEVVFAYPGQGYLLMSAVASLDYPLIQGLYLTITLSVLGANLLIDVVTVWLDPRLRRQGS
jgi:peptide/nickel transport system permease protein